jgi:DNA-binding transcriptional ArsR family regulator
MQTLSLVRGRLLRHLDWSKRLVSKTPFSDDLDEHEMILARFHTEALTRVRFAISPMFEMIRSVRTLDDPASGAIHLPWTERARMLSSDLDLAPLIALQSSEIYNPDFVNPPPNSPLVDFEEELAVMLATPPAQIRAEVAGAYQGVDLPPVLEPFMKTPRRAIEQLAELMRAYWEQCMADDWPRIRSLLEQDVLYRARQIADGGTARLFCDLDPAVSWKDGVLRIDCGECEGDLGLDERGLLLVPSVFVWPKVTLVNAEPWQPSLAYPARGIGMLWSPEQTAPPDALERLLGRTRATLLVSLDSPRSTTELAGALGVTPGGISQHLGVLRDAGLVCGRRVARSVLYMRSCEGDDLLAAAGADAATVEERPPAGAGAAL